MQFFILFGAYLFLEIELQAISMQLPFNSDIHCQKKEYVKDILATNKHLNIHFSPISRYVLWQIHGYYLQQTSCKKLFESL